MCPEIPRTRSSVVCLSRSRPSLCPVLPLNFVGSSITATAPFSDPVPFLLVLTTLVRCMPLVPSTLMFWHRSDGFGQTVTVPPEVSDSTAVATRSELISFPDSFTILVTPVVEVGSTLGGLC